MDAQNIEAALFFPTLGVGMEQSLRHDPPAVVAAFTVQADHRPRPPEPFPTANRKGQTSKDVPFRDKVWPGFLRENARRVLKLD